MTESEQVRRRDFFEELVFTGFEHQERKVSTDRQEFQRYTQDSPVMPDVWVAYGIDPTTRHDLLLTPVFDHSPGRLAAKLKAALAERAEHPTVSQSRFDELVGDRATSEPADISYNQTTVAAKLWFPELVQVALPETAWWWEKLAKDESWANHPVHLLGVEPDARMLREELLTALRGEHYDAQRGLVTRNLIWMARVVGTIAYAAQAGPDGATVDQLAKRSTDPERLVDSLLELLTFKLDDPETSARSHALFSVNRNREAFTSIYRSVPTVKGDAAQHLFSVRGRGITWAVLDSGIDATHLAFRVRGPDGKPLYVPPKGVSLFADGGTHRNDRTRVLKTYDFTRVRALLSGDPHCPFLDLLPSQQRDELGRSLASGRLVDWEMIEPALEIKHDEEYEKHVPRSHHGTHVAGILGANWRWDDDEEDALPFSNDRDERPDTRIGVCPEINMYDLRVVNDEGYGDEFSIMAALQFVRSLNARRDYVVVHGVNLSLSIPHEVANYACGRTPVCNECERLVGSGTVVVASAGNHGRARYLTRYGDEEAYSTVSITDPGNADAVITVGATHRQDPHTYGVSYFSSRGPTADGRQKPDLVAPGEKICSTIPQNREEYLDGTSMAAPHVSGAAALLMARNPELIGSPQRIKRVLCDTATDLGRERYFQGAGLLDILRALESL